MNNNIQQRASVADTYNGMLSTMFQKNELAHSPYKYSDSEIATIKQTHDAVLDFLVNKKLVNYGTTFDGEEAVGMESFNSQANLNFDRDSGIDTLLAAANIPEKHRDEAKKAVCLLLAKAKTCANNNTLLRSSHFNSSITDQKLKDSVNHSSSVIFAPSLMGLVNNFGMPGQEAFGVDVDKVHPDLPSSLTVTILQFRKGLLDRMVHRKISASSHVTFVVPYAEVYDMLKSNDASHKVRDEGDHRIPFINLYADPKAVTNLLQPIVPLAANDTEGQLLADGFVKFGHDVNLFDLSKLAGQLGKSQYNYTDLVSENVIFDSVVVQLQANGKTELIQIDTHQLQTARYQMQLNTVDSGDRSCMFRYIAKLGKDTKTVNNSPSQILAACTDTDFLRLELHVSSTISLKTSLVFAQCTGAVSGYNRANGEVAQAVKDLINGLTVNMAAYSVDAKYSEENLRKSNLAIRYHVRTFDFEVSNGRNILVDYSMAEEVPEFCMSLVTEATSLGQDHRGLEVIVRELLYVYDRANLENADPAFRERTDKLGFQYVSSQIVRPMVYLNVIDLDNVDTIRSSDILGDIRQFVEWQLMNLVSLIYQNTYYKSQLADGEIPVFKVATSSVILENIFNIPHIHNHLDKDTKPDGSVVEYRRVLPNGTVLEMASNPMDVLRDKIIMIPWRESVPEDVLNFGQNYDCGTFVASYNPQLDNAVNKRVFSNAKTMVIPTNPMGLYLQVEHLDQFINLFALINYDATKASKLPNVKELEVEQTGA